MLDNLSIPSQKALAERSKKLPMVMSLIESPRNKASLDKARSHQKYLKYHVEGDLRYQQLMIEKASEYLVEKKLKQFKTFIYPSTQRIYDIVKSDLSIVHNADGRKIECDIKEEQTERFKEVEGTVFNGVGFNDFFKKRGYNLLFTEPNAVILSDLHAYDTDEYGNLVDSAGSIVEENNPKNTVFCLDQIHDIDIKETVVKYLLIKNEYKTSSIDSSGKLTEKTVTKYYYYDDDTFIQLFEDGGDFYHFNESENILGYCPACTVSNVPRYTSDEIQMKSPVSDSIHEGNEYIEASIMTKHNQVDNGFSKTHSISTKGSCRTKGCKNGYVVSSVSGVEAPCTSCNGGKNSQNDHFYGEHLTMPDPSQVPEKAMKLYEKPYGRLDADVALLEHQDSKLMMRENQIIRMCTGKTQGIENVNVAKNEMQVQGAYDSYEQKIVFWQDVVQSRWRFLLKSVLKYMTGTDVKCTVILGNKYYLKSEKEIEETEKLSRENGAPNFELEGLRMEKLYTKYRNNPEVVTRIEILNALEPLKEYSIEQIQSLAGFIPQEDVVVKVYFNDFIRRYESELGKIVIAPETDINELISKVKNKIYEYGNEKRSGDSDRGDSSSIEED